MRSVTSIFILILVMLAGCKKSDNSPTFPPPTQTGQNILACRINGEIRVYKFKPTALNANGVLMLLYETPIDSGTLLTASSERDGMHFYIRPVRPVTGISYSMAVDYISGRESHYHEGIEPRKYIADTSESFITFNRFDEDVASGSFSFTGTNSNGEIVIITDGWFDIARY